MEHNFEFISVNERQKIKLTPAAPSSSRSTAVCLFVQNSIFECVVNLHGTYQFRERLAHDRTEMLQLLRLHRYKRTSYTHTAHTSKQPSDIAYHALYINIDQANAFHFAARAFVDTMLPLLLPAASSIVLHSHIWCQRMASLNKIKM